MTQIDERRGLRPVANAVGVTVGERYTAGIGSRMTVARSRTCRHSSGWSASLTGYARIAWSASRSLPKYAYEQNAAATAAATSRPATPPTNRPPNSNKAVRAASSAIVLSRLRWQ